MSVRNDYYPEAGIAMISGNSFRNFPHLSYLSKMILQLQNNTIANMESNK